MDMNFKEISTIIGLLIIFAGTVGVWLELKMKVKLNTRDIDRLNKKFELICDQKVECFKRFDDIAKRLGHLDVTMAETKQKLMDFIDWSKNGGRQNG